MLQCFVVVGDRKQVRISIANPTEVMKAHGTERIDFTT
jgi:hypothetical protein